MSKGESIKIHGDIWITTKDLAENARRRPVMVEFLRAWHSGDFSLEDCDIVLVFCGKLHVEALLEPLLRKPMMALVPDGPGYPTQEQVTEAMTWLPEKIKLKKRRLGHSVDVEGLRPEVAAAAELLLKWIDDWAPDAEVPRVFAHSYDRLRTDVHVWWLENWGHRDNDMHDLRKAGWKRDAQLIQKIADKPAKHWTEE